MSKTALIIVDYQRDFLPGGSLGVHEGNRAYPALVELAKEADVVVFSRDWHPHDHVSFSDPPEYRDMHWPSHCVQNSWGAEIDPDLVAAITDIKLQEKYNMFLVTKGYEQDKEAYSAFAGKVEPVAALPGLQIPFAETLAEKLREKYVTHVVIGGLALDYCVKATAVDSLNEEFATTVSVPATRPVAYETGVKAILDLEGAGVNIRFRRGDR